MKASPEISLVIPVYNAAEFYERCFGSILGQTFRDFEVIVVDDCSTDGTAERIRGFWPQDAPPCTILQNEKNMGPGISRNRGMDAARGRYLGFIDSDDAVHPSYLQTLHDLARRERAGYASCGSRTVYPDGKIGPRMWNSFVAEGREECLRRMENFHFDLSTWGSLILRDIVVKHGLRFTEGAFEDIFFNMRVLVYCGRAVVTGEMLYDYCARTTSLTHDMDRADFSYLTGFCIILPMVEEFLAGAEREVGLSKSEAVDVRKFFLRLALQRLRTTAEQMGARFEAALERELQKHFAGGDAWLYLRTFADLFWEAGEMRKIKQLGEQAQKLSAQVQRLVGQVKLYEEAVPELGVLHRRRMMAESFLNHAGSSLESVPRQPWYGEYWKLVGKRPEDSGIARQMDALGREILAWMEGKDALPRQFGALALLLVAPFREARAHIDTSLWPEKLREDLHVLEAWERLQGHV